MAEPLVGPALTTEQREKLKAKLAASGVKAMNFGVVNFTSDGPAARKVFEFARDMGLQTITCEPADKSAWDVVEKLADEFKINAACHNHPKPSQYWNPDTVLAAIRGRGPRIGCCADTGHWPRSGLKPVDCLRKYEGHTICLHFKDRETDFEQFAADLWRASQPNVDKIDVTRPWRDGGRDAVGDYLLGP